MTSIIKVDQIQNAAGSVPTAGDLGLDITGSVLATHKFISPTLSDTAITSASFTTLDTFTLDVKRNNSTMIWWVDTQQYIKSTGITNLGMRLQVDGVSVGNDVDLARYSTGTITLKYQGGGFRYLVQEIAG